MIQVKSIQRMHLILFLALGFIAGAIWDNCIKYTYLIWTFKVATAFVYISIIFFMTFIECVSIAGSVINVGWWHFGKSNYIAISWRRRWRTAETTIRWISTIIVKFIQLRWRILVGFSLLCSHDTGQCDHYKAHRNAQHFYNKSVWLEHSDWLFNLY